MSDDLFSSVFVGGTDIKSSWKSKRSVKESDSQTGIQEVKEAEAQAIERSSVEIQTENQQEGDLKLASYDETSLAAFLKRITPALLKELDKNQRSHAFEGYDLLASDAAEAITKLHTLTYPPFLDQMLRCSSISWNATGSVIAVSYGFPEHEDWCEHHGGICMWSLNRKDFDANEPTKKIEYSCCITCLQFHPEQPSLLAAGNFIGEVLLWDLGREDDMLISTTDTGSSGHHETVTAVTWTKDEKSKSSKYQIVSCGLDGKILVWEQHGQDQKLKLVNAFVIVAESLPRSILLRSSRLNSEVGITTLSFNVEDPSVFLIGSEGGGLFQCSMYSEFPAHAETNFVIPLMNPVSLTYNPHKGQVNTVASSPFSRNVFLTCSSDGEIRIYNLHQATKSHGTVHSEIPMAAAQWSPSRPLLIAAVTSDGSLNFYDARSSTVSRSIASVQLTEKSTSGWILQFNKKDPKLIATGTTDGSVQIWSLAEQFVMPSNQELESLHTIGRITSSK